MKTAFKPAHVARFLAFLASAMALSSPALATEIRYAGQLDAMTTSATHPLFSAITMGGAGEPANALLARFTGGGQLIFASRQVSSLEAMSLTTLQNVVLSQACELQGAGPCLVNENSQTLAIGVRRNADGTADVLQGNFIESYGKRAVRLSKVSDALSSMGGGASIIYSRAQMIAPPTDPSEEVNPELPTTPPTAPVQTQPPVVQQPTTPPVTAPPVVLYPPYPTAPTMPQAPVSCPPGTQQPPAPAPVPVPVPAPVRNDNYIGYCSIIATMAGQSFHLGVGFTEAAGRGVILCKYHDAPDERMPVKIITQGMGVGLGLTWDTEFRLFATGVGVTTRGARGLLGHYGLITTGGHLVSVGGEIGVGLTASRSGFSIPFGVRGKTGSGLELSLDGSGMTIVEDDGTPALLPARDNALPDHNSHTGN